MQNSQIKKSYNDKARITHFHSWLWLHRATIDIIMNISSETVCLSRSVSLFVKSMCHSVVEVPHSNLVVVRAGLSPPSHRISTFCSALMRLNFDFIPYKLPPYTPIFRMLANSEEYAGHTFPFSTCWIFYAEYLQQQHTHIHGEKLFHLHSPISFCPSTTLLMASHINCGKLKRSNFWSAF